MTDLNPVDAMTTDYRALAAELAEEVENLWSIVRDDNNESHSLVDRARALLAQPEPQPPVAGEVAAALIELRSTVMGLDQMKMYVAAQRVKRAADLLEANAQ